MARDGGITKRKLAYRANRIHDVSIPVSNPKEALVPMSRSVDTRSQAKVDDYIPWVSPFLFVFMLGLLIASSGRKEDGQDSKRRRTCAESATHPPPRARSQQCSQY